VKTLLTYPDQPAALREDTNLMRPLSGADALVRAATADHSRHAREDVEMAGNFQYSESMKVDCETSPLSRQGNPLPPWSRPSIRRASSVIGTSTAYAAIAVDEKSFIIFCS
jgi:hypothetical protein